jgi:predicted dehydrogenase
MHQVRVGFVGAGENTRVRHIPGFRKIPGVELAAVANRTESSATKVAKEFGISRVFPRWQDVVADPKIDAVCIGTWPDLHAEVTCAALAAGKHVLCEARMARNLDEARRMRAASLARPDLIAQLVPSPFGLEHHAFLREIIEDGFLGELREVVVLGADNQFWDETRPLHWRQDAAISGYNCLSLGILHETLSRFVPPTTRVFAQAACFEPVRPAAEGRDTPKVTVPESLQVVTRIEGGARGIYHLSGMILHGPGKQIHLYGRKGTIKLMFGAREEVLCGRMGQSELTKVELPPETKGAWRVEEEFIGAIRGGAKPKFTDFTTGVSYMEFTEGVARSLGSDLPVSLPLDS